MPSMPVEILPIAEDDVSQALAYIAIDDPGAAGRLLDAILEALEQVSRPSIFRGGDHGGRTQEPTLSSALRPHLSYLLSDY